MFIDHKRVTNLSTEFCLALAPLIASNDPKETAAALPIFFARTLGAFMNCTGMNEGAKEEFLELSMDCINDIMQEFIKKGPL